MDFVHHFTVTNYYQNQGTPAARPTKTGRGLHYAHFSDKKQLS